MTTLVADRPVDGLDSRYAWMRLLVSALITTIGGVAFWSVVVVLPTVEAAFGASRGGASLPYLALMIGFAVGGIVMGRVADRYGVVWTLAFGSLSLLVGYTLGGLSTSLWQFTAVHGLFIGGMGSSAVYGPMIADVSRWFVRRRGIAVSIAACGTYFAGALWPQVIQYCVEGWGWRATYVGIGVFCFATILPLSQFMRRLAPDPPAAAPRAARRANARPTDVDLPPRVIQGLLIVAGLSCCIAMAMPQVHIVALCTQLGYGAQAGVQMLSLMLATGIVSRLVFGFIGDRIGPLPTLLISSVAQSASLFLFLPFDGLAPLYLVSALFGLAQGGLVPTYALIVRAFFPAKEAAARIGLVLSATLAGMALGGWMSGEIFDMFHSYGPAFMNGIAWNLVNMSIAAFLLIRLGSGKLAAQEPPIAVPAGHG
tara:strand:- start:3605 stop:4882 length:1278 start_codon:yes stop_codon:yes gene_type:complete